MKIKKCKVKRCANKFHYAKGKFGGYCNKHMLQIKRYGSILLFTEKDKNKIINCGNFCKIYLYGRVGAGKEPAKVAMAIVDKMDINRVRKYKWGLSDKIGNRRNHIYATSRINKKIVYLHAFILGKRKGYDIDHKDRNKLNNRRSNLRFCRRSQNNINRHEQMGYCFDKLSGKWNSHITVNGKKINLGSYKTKKTAIIMRQVGEKKYYKNFSRNNNSYKIGLTFGCFDFFHYGHKNLLKNAKKLCDVLIVCVSGCDYSLKYKGKKPIWSLRKRQKFVYNYKYVDSVDKQSLVFGKKEAIEKYSPTVLFVGSDHKNDYTGKCFNVPVVYLPYTYGISSTMLRERIKNMV